MSIIAKTKSFLGPAEGTYLAVVRGIWDAGWQPGFEGSGPVQKIVAAFELEIRRADGQRHEISEVYTLSTNEKSKLRPLIEALLVRTLSDKEVAEGIDVETLVGRCALVQVKNQERNGGKYPRVTGAIPLPAGTKPITPERDRFTKSDLAKSLWDRRIVDGEADAGSAAPKVSPTPTQPVAAPVATSVATNEPVTLF